MPTPKHFPYVLVPAYGRTYPTALDTKIALFSGDDFLFEPLGRYGSIRDIPPGDRVEVRYGRENRKVLMVRMPSLDKYGELPMTKAAAAANFARR